MEVKKVLIFTSEHSRILREQYLAVCEELRALGFSLVFHEDRESYEAEGTKIADMTEAFRCSDIAIVLGGDGTTLSAAYYASRTGTPIMCINLGTVGYMSEIEYSELDMLRLLGNDINTDERMMLDAKVIRNENVAAEYTVLNEILISKGAVTSVLHMELFCDGSLVNKYRADGIIISTPTGSSAYSLSAGGPIIDTKLEAVCCCPVCSISPAGSKSLVFSPDSSFEVSAVSEKNGDIILTADGRKTFELFPGDRVMIARSGLATSFIKLKRDAFYDILYRKLR